MSVINDMLNALDARRAAPPAGAVPVATAPEKPSPRRLAMSVVLGAAAVSLAAFGDWPAWTGGHTRMPQPRSILRDAPAVAPAEDTAASSDPQASSVALPAAPAPAAPASAATPALETPRPVQAAASPPAPPSPVSRKPPPTALAQAAPHDPAPLLPGLAEKRSTPAGPAQRAALAYQQAVELGASGHPNQAITRALEALAVDPDQLGARQLAAVLMFETGRLDEAGALLQAGLERSPREPHLAFLLARLKAETGDVGAALALLPTDGTPGAEVYGLRGALLAREGRYAEALSAYEAALRQDPGNAAWWLGLGVALDAQGNAPFAKQALQRARALGTLTPDVLAYLDRKIASLQ